MKELKKIHKREYRYILEVDVHKWSRAYSPVQRYSLMTTNIVRKAKCFLKYGDIALLLPIEKDEQLVKAIV